MTDAAGGGDPLARVQSALAARFPSEDRMVPDLVRMRELMDLLGSPQRSYQSVHITGTNGKTSTARMVDAILRGFGLRPGRFTSPHLQQVTERICVDGQPLRPEVFAAAYDDIAPYIELVDSRHEHPMTFFEVLAGMAFAAFADAPVDIAVVEVGLGGTWDATNVLHAPVAVVMPIDLDHTELLGTTIEEIAAEKSGIVHAGARLVMAAQPLAAAEVLLRRSVEVGAEVAREGLEFGLASRAVAVGGQLLTVDGLGGRYDDLFLPLFGVHQAHNAACAIAAVEALLGAGEGRPLDVEAVRAGLAAVRSPGRLEVVRTSPTVVLDAAHNPAGGRVLAAAVAESFHFDRLVGVIGMLRDKDVLGTLAALEPVLDHVVATTNSSPRAMPAGELGELAADVFGDDRVTVRSALPDAIDAAIADAEGVAALTTAGVLVTGSVVTVGEARTLLGR